MAKRKREIKTFDRSFLSIFIPFLLLISIVLFFPYWFTIDSWHDIDFTATGQIGDTIGGIMGPFIAIAAAILTFFAFWVQFKANEQQKRDLKIERFENKFYELLRLHRANVDEMKIGDNISGRKSFVHMFYELRFLYITAKDFYEYTTSDLKEEYKYSEINLMDFSYKIFFFGIGLHSEKHFLTSLKSGEMHLFRQLKPFLEKAIQEKYLEHFKANPNARYYTHGMPLSEIPDDKTIEFFYFPFDGHVNRLGHYYRHLYQTATYVIEQDFINDDEKHGYLKTLRAQLPNFEQLLLYYNALAWFDDEWKEIFTKYRFIKNLPLPLADFHVRPEKHFEKEIKELASEGKAMFEWHE